MAAAEANAGLFLTVVAWCKARRLRENRAEARRQRRRLQLLAARRRRLRKLQETWMLREKVRKQSRQRRRYVHDNWMKAITHHFLTDCERRRPKVWIYPRSSDWWENTANLTDDQWLQHFRASRETFFYLCTTLKPQLKRQDTTYRLCIPLQKRVALALYKLANPCDYKTVADLFAVGVASVCRCVHEFCTAVTEVLKPQLIVTPDDSELMKMTDFFYHTYGIPQCIGVLHSMHVAVIKPPRYQSEPPNREGYLAVLLQAVVDGRGLFWDLSMSCPTWVSDPTALKESWACEDFSIRMPKICGTDSGCFILGDAGYPSHDWLLKPYTDTSWLTAEQELFNTQISQALGVARRAFQRLKGRWRCLSKRNDCSLEMVRDMVETCCVLHNLCERNEDKFLPEWISCEPLQGGNGKPPAKSETDSLLAE